MTTDKKMVALARGRTLLLSSNSLWNIQNFRSDLVTALEGDGWSVALAAPATIDQCKSLILPARVIPLDIRRSGMNPLEELRLLWTYYRLMRAEKPAAYLSWTIKPNLYGALAARAAGVPCILNVSGLGTSFLMGHFFGRFVKFLYRIAFQGAFIVYFQNRDDRDLFLRNRLVTMDQARLLPGSGINLTRFPLTPLPTDGVIRFLMVARLLRDKGIREYVQAARMTRRMLPHAKFALLGPMDSGNRSAISSAELASWVSEGVIDYLGEATDVRPFLEAATAVVLPSYREGLPRTLLEAAAMGRPLIATDVPGCRDLVENEANGFLCSARNPTSLSEAMMKFASLDIAEKARMGRRSREIVEVKFSEELVTQAYVMALASLKDTESL
jgi:glycosyltransferase involved in cell wall biosynthesis